MTPTTPLRNYRLPTVSTVTGSPRSTLYERIAAGTFVRPIKIGARAVAWPAEEVDAILAAQRKGLSDDEIKALVKRLHKARAKVGADLLAA